MKIISYSIWGKNPRYFKNLFKNIELAKELYPDWICRFYYDNTVDNKVLTDIKQTGSELILQPKSDGYYGMFWRFYPLSDYNIERFIVRDIDCLLSPREANAVKEWEESGLAFHIIRDNHKLHNFWILGGLWGAVPSKLNINIKEEINKWINKNKSFIFKYVKGKYFNMDQIFLKDVIWPKIINNNMTHESFQTGFNGVKRTFKIKNKNNMFVGQPYL